MLRRACLVRNLLLLSSGQSECVGVLGLEQRKRWAQPSTPRIHHMDLHSSAFLLKTKQPAKTQKKGKQAKAAAAAEDDDYEELAKTSGPGDLIKQLEELEDQLAEELTMHFSLRVNLRQYEQLPVKLETGEVLAMNHLGRVTMKTPSLVAINFSANPSAIKAARLALEQSALGNPQQEGPVLHLSIPRMTREKREEKVKSAKKIFNDYKDALNKVYAKHDKHAQSSLNNQEAYKAREVLLTMKRKFDKRGEDLVKAKTDALLSEMI
uniref:Ribosome-recycling factor, mitochondrial n=1 Tax=Plectus sambesii TaxID=2011161 RepID=A0A914W038_9BILA